MPTKFLNISTDNTLGGISPSDETVSSQKAIKNYVDGILPTVNDATITITQGGVTKGSFTLNQASGDTIALDAGGGGSVAIDNSTITKNLSDEIQAVATVNANTAVGATNPIYDWVGTLAEYTSQAVATNHPDWVCFITDDDTAEAYDAYSKTQSDARYVQKAHEVIEFQAPNADNNYTWYRKYRDGWVEQGGQITGLTVAANAWNTSQVTLPVTMADTNYSAIANDCGLGGNYHHGTAITTKTTTTFMYYYYNASADVAVAWEVKGIAA